MQTVARILTQHLAKWGVTHVFGIPGKPITPLVFELERQGIVYVLSKNEGGAGFAAAGYALANDSLGVALCTAGPGGTNLLTAAGQALATQLPVLFITGQPPIKEIGKVLGQDSTLFGTDLVKLFEPVTKFSARVERPELLYTYLQHALEKAMTGVKGPVHLSIPLDVLLEETNPFSIEMPVDVPPVLSTNLQQVIDKLNAAKRPLLFVGGGIHAARAYDELEKIANHWNIPVTTTPSGKGVFTSSHPLSLGPFGLGGIQASEDYLKQGVDLMLVAGSQLSDLELAGFTPALYPEQMIHFDYDITFIRKAIPVPTLPVLGDLKSNLQALLSHAPKQTIVRNPIHIKEEEMEPDSPTDYITGRQVMQILRSELPQDTVFFGDAGSHSFYAIKYLEIEQPGTFFFEEVFASMGRAIGYTTGAAVAKPSQTTVCLTGDGCMFMNGTEVSTCVNNDAPAIFVVMNNGSLDMVEKGMSQHIGKAVGTTYKKPLDAAKFGESMGALSFRCEREEELREALQKALKHRTTTVIDVIVDPFEIPPTMKRG